MIFARSTHGVSLSAARKACCAITALALSVGALSTAVVAGSATVAQTLPKILADRIGAPANALPDYSYAGYGFGIASLPDDAGTVIDVARHGAIADDERDDTQAVLKAVAAARAVPGKVTLRFPSGRFIITGKIPIDRSDFVLEGAGNGTRGTTLYFPRPLKLVDKSNDLDELRAYIIKEKKIQREPDKNIDYYYSEYSWSGGFINVGIPGARSASYLEANNERAAVRAVAITGAQWSRTVLVADGSTLRAGDIVQFQWFSTSPDSAIIASIYGNTDARIGSRHWDSPNRPLVSQPTRILSVKGNKVTIGDPLMHAISAAQPASIVRPKYLTGVGIQMLRIDFPDAPVFGHHLEQGYNGIALAQMFDGWVRDVTIHNADSGILTYDSGSVTIRNVTTSGNRRAHYSVHVGNAHNVLVQHLSVANPVIHPVSVNTQSTHAVYSDVTVHQNGVFDQHSGANHQNLFDNITMHIDPKREGTRWVYDLWDGGGAGYWKPNHGRYNTSWNTRVIVDSGARPGDTVVLRGDDQGVGESIVGAYGNRRFAVEYTPTAYIDRINEDMRAVPSLYDYQLSRRMAR